MRGQVHKNAFTVLYDKNDRSTVIRFLLMHKNRHRDVQYIPVEIRGEQAKYLKNKIKPWMQVFLIANLIFDKKYNKRWFLECLSLIPIEGNFENNWVYRKMQKKKKEEERTEALPIPKEFMLDEKDIKKF